MIFCCGEALIDMLPRQLKDGSDVFLPVSGGAVFNTAIALGRIGAPTGFVAGISKDMFGMQLLDSLIESNVETDFCIRSDHPSTLAFVKLEDGHAKYSFFDENSAGRLLATEQLPELPKKTEALHFGAISLIPEPCGSAYEALMRRHEQHAVISIDPNIRPSFIQDEASHRDRIARMIAMSDIVKVSDEDLDWIAGDDENPGAIQSWLEDSVSLVLVTKGAKGCDVFTKNFNFSAESVLAEVVDTVGAGDSFNAGILNGLRTRNLLTKSSLAKAGRSSLEEIVGEAARIAAIVVSRAGANPPWEHEL